MFVFRWHLPHEITYLGRRCLAAMRVEIQRRQLRNPPVITRRADRVQRGIGLPLPELRHGQRINLAQRLAERQR